MNVKEKELIEIDEDLLENGMMEDIEDDTPISLEDFLATNVIEGQTVDVVLCERLKKFEFEIGTMTKQQHARYIDQCFIRGKKGNIVKQDLKLFDELVVLNHCIKPNFMDATFLSKVGVQTPSQALYKVLKAGEISMLSSEIMKFNGFDNDFETYRKKVKN